MDQGQGALTQMRAYLAQRDLPANSRLPPERELCDILGVSRGELRKALAVMESNGELWRHVGKGTFIGARPADGAGRLRLPDVRRRRPRWLLAGRLSDRKSPRLN